MVWWKNLFSKLSLSIIFPGATKDVRIWLSDTRSQPNMLMTLLHCSCWVFFFLIIIMPFYITDSRSSGAVGSITISQLQGPQFDPDRKSVFFFFFFFRASHILYKYSVNLIYMLWSFIGMATACLLYPKHAQRPHVYQQWYHFIPTASTFLSYLSLLLFVGLLLFFFSIWQVKIVIERSSATTSFLKGLRGSYSQKNSFPASKSQIIFCQSCLDMILFF